MRWFEMERRKLVNRYSPFAPKIHTARYLSPAAHVYGEGRVGK